MQKTSEHQTNYKLLKSLLLEEENQSINEAEGRIEQLSNELNILKTDAPFVLNVLEKYFVEEGQKPDSQFSTTVSKMIPVSIKKEIKTNPEPIIDSLYPTIGAMIARYVSESLADFMDQINDKINKQLPIEQITRKIKAKFSGLSETELLIKECSPTIESVFLIQTHSGILLHNAKKDLSEGLNADLFAGLVTALVDFSKDATKLKNKTLNEIQYGDKAVIFETAGSVLLAVITQEKFSSTAKHKLREVLNSFLGKNREFLSNFSGDTNTIPKNITQELDSLVKSETKTQNIDEKKLSPAKKALIIALVCLASLFMFRQIRNYQLNSYIKEHSIFKDFKVKSKRSLLGAVEVTTLMPKEYQSMFKNYINLSGQEIEAVNFMPETSNLAKEIVDPLNIKEFHKEIENLPYTRLKLIPNDNSLYLEGSVLSQQEVDIINKIMARYSLTEHMETNLQIKSELFEFKINYNVGETDLAPEMVEGLETLLKNYDSSKGKILLSGSVDGVGSQSAQTLFFNERLKNILSTLTTELELSLKDIRILNIPYGVTKGSREALVIIP